MEKNIKEDKDLKKQEDRQIEARNVGASGLETSIKKKEEKTAIGGVQKLVGPPSNSWH